MGLIDRFVRLPGTERNYLDLLTGEHISRRERDSRESSIPVKDRQSYLDSIAETRLGSLASDLSNASGGRGIDGVIRDTFLQVLDDLYDPDNSPGGKKAQALVRIGRRSRSDTFDVGDS